MRRVLTSLAALVLIAACGKIESAPVNIVPCAPMPEARTSARAFSVGDKCYVFGGRDVNDNLPTTLYCYDTTEDKWTNIGQMPMCGRINPCCAVVDGLVYLGLGATPYGDYSEEAHFRDWWRFDPSDLSWTRLEDFPVYFTTGMVTFVHDNKIECLYGYFTEVHRKIYVYDIDSGKWSLNKDGEALPRMAATGAAIKNELFFGTGFDAFNFGDWFSYSSEGKWTRLRDVPGKRLMASSASTSSFVYLAGGLCNGGSLTGGQVYNEVLKFSPEENKWYISGHLREGAMNMISFTVGGKPYFGLGETFEGKLLDTIYRIDD